MVDPLIALFDDDNNGDIRMGELETLTRKFDRGGDELTPQLFNKIWTAVDAFFDVCDSDNSGGCTFQEMFTMVETIGAPWLPMITDKNGEFGVNQFYGTLTWSKNTADWLKFKCDTDGSGGCSLAEIQGVIRNNFAIVW